MSASWHMPPFWQASSPHGSSAASVNRTNIAKITIKCKIPCLSNNVEMNQLASWHFADIGWDGKMMYITNTLNPAVWEHASTLFLGYRGFRQYWIWDLVNDRLRVVWPGLYSHKRRLFNNNHKEELFLHDNHDNHRCFLKARCFSIRGVSLY